MLLNLCRYIECLLYGLYLNEEIDGLLVCEVSGAKKGGSIAGINV